MSSHLNSGRAANTPKKRRPPCKEEKDFPEVYESELKNLYITYGDDKGMSVDELLKKIELFG